MLKKIEERNIITFEEASQKYNNCRFLFIFTELIGHASPESKGYVAYTFNDFSESFQIPDYEEEQGIASANTFGVDFDPEPYPCIGGVYSNG